MTLIEKIESKKVHCAVVGLGYVGLPLAVEFGKIIPTTGFDLNSRRVSQLKDHLDVNHETSAEELKAARYLRVTDRAEDLKEADFIVVAVPTPITKSNQPDLACLTGASEIVGRNLKKGSLVVFESTVYPGVTEEICVPILERASGLRFGEDFKVGYSPERINPGDKEHTLARIVKVVSGSDAEALRAAAAMYGLVVQAGIFEAGSIKCAEAAKVIENTQRDLNIALMNELAIIFNRMGIDTLSVLNAAGTKWNFIRMTPGLVGGHCIGVDPYYLTYKAEEMGYVPQVILAGRRINDGMGKYIAEQTVKKMIDAGCRIKGARVLLAGMTFKENVGDIRNSKAVDIVRELQEYGVEVTACDPLADSREVEEEYGLTLVPYSPEIQADAVVIAVAHQAFVQTLTAATVSAHFAQNSGCGLVMDVKGTFRDRFAGDAKISYWRL